MQTQIPPGACPGGAGGLPGGWPGGDRRWPGRCDGCHVWTASTAGRV